MYNLAQVLVDLGQLEEAESWARRLIEVSRRVFGTTSVRTISAIELLGEVFLEQGKLDDAEVTLREVITDLHKAGGSAKLAESLLGGCLSSQGRYEEAEPLLLKSWPSIERARNMPPTVRGRALNRVITLYELWGKPEPAVAWRLKRFDLAFPAEPFAR
jgi:tetratricopeptide (TPR) repeat protein